jgi:DNA-directed RNA polymerase specialized sigma24 family protein
MTSASPDRTDDPAQRSAQASAHARTITALADLDRIDRAALRLIYWHGRTHEQVAAELNLSAATVRAAVAHGMRQLAAVITGA